MIRAAGFCLTLAVSLAACGGDPPPAGQASPPATAATGAPPAPLAAGSFVARVVSTDLEAGRITLREPSGGEGDVRVAEAALKALASLKAGEDVRVACDQVGTVPIPPKGDRPEAPGAAGTTGPAGGSLGTGAIAPGAAGLAGCGTVTTLSPVEMR